MALEKKLKQIRKSMGGIVVFEVGIKPGGKVDILSAKNMGMIEKPEMPVEEGMEYIG